MVTTTRAARASVASDTGSAESVTSTARPSRGAQPCPTSATAAQIAGQPDADPGRHMTGQVTGHQPPGETGGAEHHNIELTVPVHHVTRQTTTTQGS